MKSAPFLCAFALVASTGCKVIDAPGHARPAKPVDDTPETVMVTYHVQTGHEKEFQTLLAQAWDAYKHEHLVRPEPHLVVEQREANGKTKFVEVFTWVNHTAPNKSITSIPIQALWGQETALCEVRDGHAALEGGEVKLITP